MDKIDLSIVLPTIRVQNLPAVYHSIVQSIGKYTFELICVGPLLPPEELCGLANFKFVKDWGCISRCTQIGLLLAEGEYFCWNSDDALLQPKALEECIDLLKTKTQKDGIVLRYYEGINRQGKLPDDSYWIARTHKDQQLPGILEGWKVAPVGMYNTNYIKELGFLDTRFEHVNMNSHDLAFRVQKNGGELFLSPSCVMICDWEPGYSGSHIPVEQAYHQNDKGLFEQLYSVYNPNRIEIDINNWKNSPRIWKRRFSVQ